MEQLFDKNLILFFLFLNFGTTCTMRPSWLGYFCHIVLRPTRKKSLADQTIRLLKNKAPSLTEFQKTGIYTVYIFS